MRYLILLVVLWVGCDVWGQCVTPPDNLHVFSISGDSNAKGDAKNKSIYQQTHPYVFFWDMASECWEASSHGPLWFNGRPASETNAWIIFGAKYMELATVAGATVGAVGLIPAARGGSNISEWYKPGTLFFDSLKNVVSRLMPHMRAGDTYRGMQWQEGSNIAGSALYGCNYKLYLDTLIDHWRDTVTARAWPAADTIMWVASQIFTSGTCTDSINTHIEDLPNRLPKTAAVLNDSLYGEDGIHYSYFPQRTLGARHAWESATLEGYAPSRAIAGRDTVIRLPLDFPKIHQATNFLVNSGGLTGLGKVSICSDSGVVDTIVYVSGLNFLQKLIAGTNAGDSLFIEPCPGHERTQFTWQSGPFFNHTTQTSALAYFTWATRKTVFNGVSFRNDTAHASVFRDDSGEVTFDKVIIDNASDSVPNYIVKIGTGTKGGRVWRSFLYSSEPGPEPSTGGVGFQLRNADVRNSAAYGMRRPWFSYNPAVPTTYFNTWAYSPFGTGFINATGGSNNLSIGDASAPGTSSLTNVPMSDMKFGNIAGGDLGVYINSVTQGAGTTQSTRYTTDIEGQTITTWMIGPDYSEVVEPPPAAASEGGRGRFGSKFKVYSTKYGKY